MGQRGRPRKPAHLKILAGNPGKRPLEELDGVPVAPGIPDPPSELTGDAVTEWVRVTSEMNKSGRITQLDRAALAGYCQSWSDWLHERRKIAETGTVMTLRNDKGEVKGTQISPHVQLALKHLDKLKAFAVELGLSKLRDGSPIAEVGRGNEKARFFAG